MQVRKSKLCFDSSPSQASHCLLLAVTCEAQSFDSNILSTVISLWHFAKSDMS